MVKDNDYAYAVAKIKALSTRLFDQAYLMRMVDAEDMDSLIKLLSGRGYPVTSNLDESLDQELVDSYRFCEGLLIDEHKNIITALRKKYDYHNCKALIKAELLGENKDELLSECGSIDPEILSEAVRERNFGKLPGEMGNAVKECFAYLEQERNTHKCDIILDRACYSDMLQLAKEANNAFFIKYVKDRIDVSNIIAFFRIKKNGGSEHDLKEILVSGGTIGTRNLNVGMGYDALKSYLKEAGFGQEIESAVEQLEKEGSFTSLERLLDDYLIHFIKSVKYQSFGPEPIIAYLFAKESELTAVRIIASGKIGGVDDDIIRERLRETYV